MILASPSLVPCLSSSSFLHRWLLARTDNGVRGRSVEKRSFPDERLVVQRRRENDGRRGETQRDEYHVSLVYRAEDMEEGDGGGMNLHHARGMTETCTRAWRDNETLGASREIRTVHPVRLCSIHASVQHSFSLLGPRDPTSVSRRGIIATRDSPLVRRTCACPWPGEGGYASLRHHRELALASLSTTATCPLRRELDGAERSSHHRRRPLISTALIASRVLLMNSERNRNARYRAIDRSFGALALGDTRLEFGT